MLQRDVRSLFAASAGILALVAFAVAALTPWTAGAQGSPWTRESALKQIDESADDFRTATADIEFSAVDSTGAEPRTGAGKAYFHKDGKVRIDLATPAPRTILLTGNDLYVYIPAESLVEKYSVSQHPERLEPYVVLGFSLTGEDLTKTYLVTLLGEETVGDRKTILLELTPTSDKARETVSKVRLSIGQTGWMPVVQEVHRSGDTSMITTSYRNVSRNVEIEDDLFKAKWPKGTKTVKK